MGQCYTVEVESESRTQHYVWLRREGRRPFIFADSSSRLRAAGVADFVRDNPHVARAIIAEYEPPATDGAE